MQNGPGVQGKRWPKYRYCFACLKVRGGSPPSNRSLGSLTPSQRLAKFVSKNNPCVSCLARLSPGPMAQSSRTYLLSRPMPLSTLSERLFRLATRATIYRSAQGPPAPKSPKTKKASKRVFVGVCKKSPKIPENVTNHKMLQEVQFRVLFDFFGYFRGLFCRHPKRLFLRLFGDWGPETTVNGRSGRKFRPAHARVSCPLQSLALRSQPPSTGVPRVPGRESAPKIAFE